MSNMLQTIVPKSDQLNADSLIGGPRTIKVTSVNVAIGGDQPVTIHYEGEDGRPYKPCMSMRRLLVLMWGPDANVYAGRSMTVYNDERVTWAGQAVGGIRISHLSHIDAPKTVQLTATKGKRASHTVHPLQQPSKPITPELPSAEAFATEYDLCESQESFDALEAKRAANWKRWKSDEQKLIRAAVDAAKAKLSNPQPAGELFTGGTNPLPD